MPAMKPQGWDLAAWGLALYLGASLLSALAPGVGLLSLVGLVVFFVGLYQIGQATGRMQVFTDQLIGRLLLWVGGFLILLVFGGLALFGAFADGNDGGVLLGSALLGWLLFWLLSIASGWFTRRGYKALAEVSGRPLFNLAGDLIFWGSVAGLLIVGYVVAFAGEVVALVAFFNPPPSKME